MVPPEMLVKFALKSALYVVPPFTFASVRPPPVGGVPHVGLHAASPPLPASPPSLPLSGVPPSGGGASGGASGGESIFTSGAASGVGSDPSGRGLLPSFVDGGVVDESSVVGRRRCVGPVEVRIRIGVTDVDERPPTACRDHDERGDGEDRSSSHLDRSVSHETSTPNLRNGRVEPSQLDASIARREAPAHFRAGSRALIRGDG